MRAPELVSRLGIALACVLFSAVIVHAQEASTNSDTNTPSLSTELKNEEVPGLPSVTRAFVTVGTNEYAFLVPRTYRVVSDSDKITLNNPDFTAHITIRVLPAAPSQNIEELIPYCRALVLDELPDALMQNEYTRMVDRVVGPVFDASRTLKEGGLQTLRIVFVPRANGLLEFRLATTPEVFRRAGYKLNNLLLSFRTRKNGQLDITPLSNKF